MIEVLMVDDEKPICDLVDLNLSVSGYHCTSIQGGAEALRFIENQFFDPVLLDIILPGVDGYDITSYIRPMDTPVIPIAARHEIKGRVKGLRLGASDYLMKPFDVVELAARVGAVPCRYSKTERLLIAGDVTVDMGARRITRVGRNVELANKELGLLVLFIQNKNMAFSRETLHEKVWGREYSGDDHTLDLHMQRLRRELGRGNNLVAVYKVGYRPEVVQ